MRVFCNALEDVVNHFKTIYESWVAEDGVKQAQCKIEENSWKAHSFWGGAGWRSDSSVIFKVEFSVLFKQLRITSAHNGISVGVFQNIKKWIRWF